jgi:hypothetical protein
MRDSLTARVEIECIATTTAARVAPEETFALRIRYLSAVGFSRGGGYAGS